MALSQPRSIFGIHSVAPYSRTDGTSYGILKVLEDSSLQLQGKLVSLMGGSSKYPWAVEEGEINAQVSLKVSEYPDFLFTLFLGQSPTSSGVSATGSVSALVNKQGTSLMNATTGIASIAITASTGAANLKFGKYVVKVVSATTVDVYISSDADFARGSSALSYQDDTLKITATALTITTTGGITVIPNTGLQFVGGSGTIGMTTGDTATFSVLPPSTKSMTVNVGAVASVFPEFGMIAMAKKKGTGELFELDIYRCKGQGLPIGMAMNAFGKTDIKIDAFYDSAQDGVFGIRNLVP